MAVSYVNLTCIQNTVRVNTLIYYIYISLGSTTFQQTSLQMLSLSSVQENQMKSVKSIIEISK